MPFFYQSKKILNRFFDTIKGTKDDVIIGLVTSITLLCSQQRDVSISALCNRLDVKMSTIHRQVEKRVMQRFKVPGFKSLVKSADLLKKVMHKLGVLDPPFINVSEKPEPTTETDDMILVVLGNAKPVFNSFNMSKNYYFFLRNLSGFSVTSIINEENNDKTKKTLLTDDGIITNKSDKIDNKDKVKLELCKYYNPKGPPIIC